MPLVRVLRNGFEFWEARPAPKRPLPPLPVERDGPRVRKKMAALRSRKEFQISDSKFQIDAARAPDGESGCSDIEGSAPEGAGIFAEPLELDPERAIEKLRALLAEKNAREGRQACR